MKILIVGPSWIGDMVMSQSVYKLLIQKYLNIQIDVIAPSWCCQLLNFMSEINCILEMPIKHGMLAIRQRYQLGKLLRHKNYHQALILPNSFKSALIPFFANIPKRTGWRGEMRYGLLNDIRILDKQAFPLMIQRYAALVFNAQLMQNANALPLPFPYPKLKVNIKDTQYILNHFIPYNERMIIGLCPTAFNQSKRWPHYHYITLAHLLIKRNYQVILFGSDKDYNDNEMIIAKLPKIEQYYCHNMAGKINLKQTVALIAACQGIVSNDSGLMHIASALELPLIALYGPSSPDFTPPLSNKAKVIRLINGYYKIKKQYKKRYHQSLIDIKPDLVLYELEKLLHI